MLSHADSEKLPEAIHRWRRINAMASAKVGAGLAYQAAVRWIMGCCCCNRWAARVVQEVPSGLEWCARWPGQTTGAGSPHPNEPGFRESDFQLPGNTNHSRICAGVPPSWCTAALGERIRLAGLESAPAEGHRRLAGMIPDGGLRADFHRARGAIVPSY